MFPNAKDAVKFVCAYKTDNCSCEVPDDLGHAGKVFERGFLGSDNRLIFRSDIGSDVHLCLHTQRKLPYQWTNVQSVKGMP